MSDLEHYSRTALRQSEQDITDEDLLALRTIRQQALLQPAKRLPNFLTPVVGMVAASLVALVLIYNPVNNPDAEINGDTAELYEDLDFYSWLVAEKSDIQG